MTDTASTPITGPHLTPMFATGAQDALAPSTEPHPSPIFDTGPHPDPLQAVGAPQAFSELENADNDTFLREHSEPVVVPGRGGGFSLETPEGLRFLSRGRAFTASEVELLAQAPPLTGADYEAGARPLARTDLVVADAADACQIPVRRAEAVQP